MPGDVCPNCAQPLPAATLAQCPACGTRLAEKAGTDSLLRLAPDLPARATALTRPVADHPPVNNLLPVIISPPPIADLFAQSKVMRQQEQSGYFTWLGCLGTMIALLGIVVMLMATFLGRIPLIIGGVFLLAGILVAVIFYRRSLRLDDEMDRQVVELALHDYHHLEP